MKKNLRFWFLTLLPLGAWAQAPTIEFDNGIPQRTSPSIRKAVTQVAPVANLAVAACTNTTTLNFSNRPLNEDWKNHVPVNAGSASTNTTISTAGSYIEPAGGNETILRVSNNGGSFTGQPLWWNADYSSPQNATTQITYSFNRPVNNFSLRIQDIDTGANSFIDAVTFTATQADGAVLNLSSNDATVVNNTAYTSVSGNTIRGLQPSDNLSDLANVTVTFNKPIVSFQITYQNLLNISNPGNQFIAIDYMTWCTQANVATTLSGPARALPGTQVTYTATTTASGDYGATNVRPVVQLSPGLNSQSPLFPAGSSYDNTTGLLTLTTVPTLNTGASSTSIIKFNMPSSTVTGKASSTIDTDDSDPSDNNGSLATANVTTTVNQAPTAQAKTATVSRNTAVYTSLPAMTGTDPDNDQLTYTILGSSIVPSGFGVVYYTNNGARTAISGTSNVTLTAAQAATLEFQRGGNAGTTTGTFQYYVSDPYGGVSTTVNYALSVGDQPAVYSSPNYTIVDGTNLQNEVIATVTDPDGAITGATLVTGTGGGVSLPTNLQLNSDGSFTRKNKGDIPTGTYNFVVRTTGPGTTTVPVTIVITSGADNASAYSTNNRFNRDALTSGMTLATVTDPDAPLTAASLATGSTLPSGMTIDGTSGRITVGSTAPFAGTYTYSINTTDAAGGSSTPSVTITVFNDTEAIYAVAAAPSGVYTNGYSLATVTDADGAINTATAVSGTSTLPAGVGLNSTTGQFTVTNRLLLKPGSYPVQVTTRDVTGGLTTQTVTIVIKGNPLPVELVSFVAKAAGQDAQLVWRTAQELRNDHFTVERSFDGKTFSSVAQVAGQGTTTLATDYRFTDTQVGAKVAGQPVYYRLRQVDTDGTSSFSSVQVLTFDKAETAVSVTPNPASSQAALDLGNLAEGTYQVIVRDVTGRLVYQGSVKGGLVNELSVSQWPTGIYLIQVKGQSVVKTARLIKE